MQQYPIAVIQYIENHLHEDPIALLFKKSPFPNYSMKEIVAQIKGRQVAAKKFPFVLEVDQFKFPNNISLQQASSENTARYKASIIQGDALCDLTGGMGIDTLIMGEEFSQITYVEPNHELCSIFDWNKRYFLDDRVDIVNDTAENYLNNNNKKYDWIYVDPSRRAEGDRFISIVNLAPNVVELQDRILAISNQYLLKLSPMQDIAELRAKIKLTERIDYVSVKGELKEILVIIGNESDAMEHRVVMISDDVKVYQYTDETTKEINYSPTLRYLYIPDVAFTKSGFHDAMAAQCDIFKLHQETNIYTSDILVADFPGRAFEVVHISGLRKKMINPYLDADKINVITKNFPLSASEVKKKLKIKDGGNKYLMAYTDVNEEKIASIAKRIY